MNVTETAVHILLWIVTGACGLVWLLVAAGNAAIVAARLKNRSSVGLQPLIGGVFGVLAVWLLPLDLGYHRLAWALVPALLDVGCLPVLFAALVAHSRRAPTRA